MAQKPHVPQFGQWDNNGTAYTKFFDNARKVKGGGKMVNPNDPEENPELFGMDAPPVEAPPSKHESDLRDSKLKDELSTEGHAQEHGGRKTSSESPQHRHRERREHGHRTARTSGGSENSIDHSPLHPYYQAMNAGRVGAASPSKSSDSNRTPGRSRAKASAQSHDSLEKGSAVPKFGDWDEKNPSAGDSYTHIFNKVREEKETGSKKSPMITDDSIYMNDQNDGNVGSGCSCFSWFGRK